MSDDLLIDEIKEIRARNNILWMEIVRVALSKSPTVIKSFLRDINENDRKISTLLKEIAGE